MRSMPVSQAVRVSTVMLRSMYNPNKDKGYEFVNNIVGGAIPKEHAI